MTHLSKKIDKYPANYWQPEGEYQIRCMLCPRGCRLRDGQRGLCFVRQNIDQQLYLTAYGKTSGFAIDPIEKKPLFHFYPGSSILSFGSIGCNLTCKFCQNWRISKNQKMDRLSDYTSPMEIVSMAKENQCDMVAFTYNDPIISIEYVMDVAKACQTNNIKTVAVTAGYISPAARVDFFRYMDATNIDLKAFTQSFYHKLTSGHLDTVLETLKYVKKNTDCWLEITNLLIPGENDSPAEIESMSHWIATHLSSDVPLHFSAFHPDFKLKNKTRTSLASLQMARKIAQTAGLTHIYLGNVMDEPTSATYCGDCQTMLIKRKWHNITENRLQPGGYCSSCKNKVAGKF